jgi:uncharacterized RDD family membrane protein YckC
VRENVRELGSDSGVPMSASQDDPYQPPHVDTVIAPTRRPIVRASKGRRFGTLVIDYIAFVLGSGCFGLAMGFTLGDAALEKIRSVPDVAIGGPLMLCYYLFFEGIWARTPGKLILGTVVVDEAGDRPSFARVVGRTLCRFIPFDVFSFLGERGWHDSISKTHVVLAHVSEPMDRMGQFDVPPSNSRAADARRDGGAVDTGPNGVTS